MPCPRCETLPDVEESGESMLLWPPLGHTQSKIVGATKDDYALKTIPGGISFDLRTISLSALLDRLKATLTPGELNDTNCLLLHHSGEPTLSDLAAITSLRRLTARAEARYVTRTLQGETLTTMFQPIVDARQPFVPFAHECLLRVEEGDRLLPPARLFEGAKEADLLFQLDRAAREVHIRNFANTAMPGRAFINFTPTAIYDPNNCLRTTFAIADEVGLKPEQIVFEVIETEKVNDTSHLKSILDVYRDSGFQVALDDLGAGHATLQMLGELLPDYVKLDMELIRNVHQSRYKSELVTSIIELAHKFSIKVVAEGVESIEESSWLISQNVDFMQGYYFAKPHTSPVETIEKRALET